ncbi:MAG TPA: hypothetical protein VFD03_03420 [Clostridia bacterium]|nr:hypothetical protein [Clostridia bacterium]
MTSNVITCPEFYGTDGLIVGEPYEQMMGTLRIEFILKQNGSGDDNLQHQIFLSQAVEYKGNPPCFIELEYKVFNEKRKIGKEVVRIPISDILVENIVKR